MGDESTASNPATKNLGGGAASLLEQHSGISKGAGRGPRGPYRKTKDRQGAPAGAAPSAPSGMALPPSVALPEVMASATGLFYASHAALFDDEDWLVADPVKKEVGNIMAWMLADDFYKVGGVGKYVVGGVMFLSVYAMQAQKTAKTRRARLDDARRRQGLPPLAGGARPSAPPAAVMPPAPMPQAPPSPAEAAATLDITPGEHGPLVTPPPGFGAPETPPQV